MLIKKQKNTPQNLHHLNKKHYLCNKLYQQNNSFV